MTPREELQALAECAIYAQKAVEVSKKLWEGHPKYPHELPLYAAARVFAGVAQRALHAACAPEALLEALHAEATKPPADAITLLLRTDTNVLYLSDLRDRCPGETDEELVALLPELAKLGPAWMVAQRVVHGRCKRVVMHPYGVSIEGLLGTLCACGAYYMEGDEISIDMPCLVRRSSLTGTK